MAQTFYVAVQLCSIRILEYVYTCSILGGSRICLSHCVLYMRCHTTADMRERRGKPLLFWALKHPIDLAELLGRGADPNVPCRLGADLCVTPLYALAYGLRAPRDPAQARLVKSLLVHSGGRVVRYSDFCVIDIK